MGHEFSGTITGVGAGVTGYAPGDRVAIEPIYRCGNCAPCRAGTYNVCRQIGFHGLMSDSGMAEYTVVPADMLHRLPDNVSLELGAWSNRCRSPTTPRRSGRSVRCILR